MSTAEWPGRASALLLRLAKYGLEPVGLEDTDHYRMMREFILDWRGTVEAMLEE